MQSSELQRDRENFWFTFHMIPIAQGEPGQSQEPKSSIQISHPGIGAKVPGPPSAAFLGSLAGTWIRIGTVGLIPVLQYWVLVTQL